MSKLVTIYGGSGFLGRRVARQMADLGWRVRVACRRPNEAGVVRSYGDVGQVEPVPCNVRDDISVIAAMADADAVINCVGILVREGRNNFDAVHDEAAGRIARHSADRRVAHFVQISSIGADPDSKSRYAASKGRGEEAVLESRPDAVILRPSVMFGQGDGLYNRIGALSRLGPILFVPGANTRMQPVFVDDVARAAALGATGQAAPGVYELGGPDVLTMRQIARQVVDVTGRRRAIVGIPGFMSGLMGAVFDAGQWITGGLVTNRIITRDQARQLRRHNIVTDNIMAFADLGITPVASAAVIPDYLWRFRKSGQYDAIKASAKNLREL